MNGNELTRVRKFMNMGKNGTIIGLGELKMRIGIVGAKIYPCAIELILLKFRMAGAALS
jgi:hypothetical protein